jgi:hypothetical protein
MNDEWQGTNGRALLVFSEDSDMVGGTMAPVSAPADARLPKLWTVRVDCRGRMACELVNMGNIGNGDRRSYDGSAQGRFVASVCYGAFKQGIVRCRWLERRDEATDPIA